MFFCNYTTFRHGLNRVLGPPNSYSKRSREEDGSDSMPLSKRINNLHINNQPNISSQQQQQQHHASNAPSLVHDEDATMVFQPQQSPSFEQQQQQQLQIQQQQQLHMQHQHLQMQQHHHQATGNSFMFQQHQHQTSSAATAAASTPSSHQQFQHHQNNTSSSSNSSCSSSSHNGASSAPDVAADLAVGYEPELTDVENPFYYSKNKLLYDLHAERMRRHP